jgi:uncharacterized membrane protein
MTATPYSASTAPFDSQLPVPSRPSRSDWPWWLMTIMSGGTAIYAAHYFLGRPTGHFGEHFPILLAHITGGSVALLLGPWQFSTKLRERALNLHRWLGRIYLAAVALGSLAGFTLAFFSEEGPPTHFGFGALAVLWFATGLTAYRRILRGNIESHRQWMVRNYALALAAVTLRNELPLMLVARMQFSHAYVIVSWLCWVPNLLVAEWLLRRQASQVKHFSP